MALVSSARSPTRRQEPTPLPAWVALWASIAFHGQLLLGLVLLGGSGDPRAGGEGGIAGAGGDLVEVTWARVVVPEPETETQAEADTEAETQAETQAEAQAEAEVLTASEPAPVRAPPRAERAPRDEPRPEPEPTLPEEPAAIARDGAERTESGRAEGDPDVAAVILGSVGLGASSSPGARALLERALACGDPIEGVWVAHRYSPERHQWARFTLRIDREDDRLSGTILARSWAGRATDRRPPPCVPGGHDVTVRMVARGWLRGEELSFGADTHEILRVECEDGMTAYAPDHFTGRIAISGDELDVVNNDGVYEFNAPYRFRRTGCLE